MAIEHFSRLAKSPRSATTTAATLGALALARSLLASVGIVGYIAVLLGDTAAGPAIGGLLAFNIVALAHGIRGLLRVRADPRGHHVTSWATVVLDATLSVSVLGAIDTDATPLAWIALLFPVVEAAILFSIMPAAIVWLGVSLAFLAVRLTIQRTGSDADALRLAVQQLAAVFLISGPAAFVSDSSQQRVRELDQARRAADDISDQLRRISSSAREMSQAKDPSEVLDVALSSVLSMGFDQADVVVRSGPATWTLTHAQSVGVRDVPPAHLLAEDAGATLSEASARDVGANDYFAAADLVAGYAVRASPRERDEQVVLRVWSSTPRDATEVRALALFAEQMRELYRIALLLGDAHRHANQLEHEIRHDGLTGLANRNWVLQNLSGRLTRRQQTAVFFIDLDGFKAINDTLGHSAGDDALKEVAIRLRTCFDERDIVGRMGGDEFIVVMRSPDAGAEDPAAIGQRIVDLISEPMTADGQPAQLGASVGLAVSTAFDSSADQLITRADTAMYEAKRAGGGVRVAATEHTQIQDRAA